MIRYSEVFYSVSGEGETVGVPTVYVRLFGCNFQCKGFPCDSEFSWNKKLNHYKDADTKELCDLILSTCPFDNWYSEISNSYVDLSITGGEPLLPKNQKAILSILKELEERKKLPKRITFETNGTQPLCNELREYIKRKTLKFFFSVSPKLKSLSLEKYTMFPDIIKDYFYVANMYGQVKIVIDSSDESWDELLQYKFLRKYPIWIMPIGNDAQSQSTLDTRKIAEKALSYGFKVSPRLHATIWNDMIGK